jgi:Tol biopolymer transport system component
MAFEAGSTLGPYEIVGALGAGGMGEVYKAHDSRLRRDVAIKVLPAVVADDENRLKRFEQEALATAALNHPNILVVFDVGKHAGTAYVVEELLEGRTLRDLTSTESLPVRKVVDFAIQVANGLAAAHTKGIIHRDLKPENLFVTTDDRIKILDFGLAKIVEATSGSGASTMLAAGTEPGLVLGTIGYMSPEQVRGVAVDHRADIFSFGAILYELLTGRRAFGGETAADTMTAILKEPPADPAESGRPIPPALARVVDRCLEKNPASRFQSASDLAFALQNVGSDVRSGSTMTTVAPIVEDRRRRLARRGLAAVAFIIVGAALAVGAWSWLTPPGEPIVLLTLDIAPPPDHELEETSALSPDGRHLAFAATDGAGRTQLWVRTLDTGESRVLEGTDDARNPFWSPTGDAIGYFDGQRLRIVNLANGRVRIVCDATGQRTAGSWNEQNVILFATETRQPIRRVRAVGQGTPEALAYALGFRPHFLPGGRYFLFHGRQGGGGGGIEIGDVETGTATRLRGGRDGQYAAGYLLFVTGQNLMAQRFDLASRTLQGQAVEVADVGPYPGNVGPTVSVGGNGLIAVRRRSASDFQLAWYTRDGQRVKVIEGSGHWTNPEFSPDDSRLAAQRDEHQGAAADIWIHDVAKNTSRAVSAHQGSELLPVWSADSQQLSFGRYARRPGGRVSGAWVTSSFDGSPEKSMPYDPQGTNNWVAYAPDRGALIGFGINSNGNRDILLLPLSGDIKPEQVVSTPFNETQPALSRDGKWLAYISDESGETSRTVFVQPFPGGGPKQAASAEAGGVQPRWRADGRELFYLGHDSRLMAVSVEQAGAALRFGKPQALFETSTVAEGGVGSRAHYAVTRDGQRFVVAEPRSGGPRMTGPITVFVNWTSAPRTAKKEPQ